MAYWGPLDGRRLRHGYHLVSLEPAEAVVQVVADLM
jgi:hypothetical protein